MFSAFFGGPHTGVDEEYQRLQRTVQPRLILSPATGLDAVSLHWLVEGTVGRFSAPEAGRLRLVKARRIAYLTVGFPRSAYEGASQEAIRRALCERVEEGLNLLVARLRKDGLDDGESLLRDWRSAQADFLR